MLSRLAEELYWHGRYLERAEGLARLVNVNAHLNLDLPSGIAPGWEPLVRITGNSEHFRELFDEASERNVARYLIGDDRNPGSIRSSLEYARGNMRAARDLLPREVWERMNALYLDCDESMSGTLSKRKRHDVLNGMILGCQQITGMLDATMSRDFAYDFMLLGRFLERADTTTRILDVRADDLLGETDALAPFESIQWMSVLKSLTAYQMYRRHVRTRVLGTDVLKFLMRDRQLPRSVMFCLDALAVLLEDLPGDDDTALRATVSLMRRVDGTRMAKLRGEPLSEFLDGLQVELAAIAQRIAQTWFLRD